MYSGRCCSNKWKKKSAWEAAAGEYKAQEAGSVAGVGLEVLRVQCGVVCLWRTSHDMLPNRAIAPLSLPHAGCHARTHTSGKDLSLLGHNVTSCFVEAVGQDLFDRCYLLFHRVQDGHNESPAFNTTCREQETLSKQIAYEGGPEAEFNMQSRSFPSVASPGQFAA